MIPRWWCAAVATLGLAAACGAGPATTSSPATVDNQVPDQASSDVAAIIDTYRALRDEMCACKDARCASQTKAASDQLERDARASGVEPTEAEGAEFEAIEGELNRCHGVYVNDAGG